MLLKLRFARATENGFDLDMIRAMRSQVTIPIIASGGAGKVEDFPPAIAAGADAVLAASVFHYGKMTIGDVKAITGIRHYQTLHKLFPFQGRYISAATLARCMCGSIKN